MKISLFTITLSCMLFAAAANSRAVAGEPATAPKAGTEQTQAFYTDYCTFIAQGPDSAAEPKLRECLTPETLRKVTRVRTEQLYDPIIRAQDFDTDAVATITVTHVDGAWYAVAYLDRYNNKCVVIPVKATVENGALKITDITIR
ncbi:DUF3828 domain-containing protein [Alistipes sp. D31t1_170403_E11]|uniref:DUF3828 domain-containing protein n=1 Tax=Alistipes sp. D31t1_170403_E11 TaxID=2787128 RepID=UPI00189BD90A|nr:DUF3828 domain-containing protein [Alistipes sp. D31t1_170403_E11]